MGGGGERWGRDGQRSCALACAVGLCPDPLPLWPAPPCVVLRRARCPGGSACRGSGCPRHRDRAGAPRRGRTRQRVAHVPRSGHVSMRDAVHPDPSHAVRVRGARSPLLVHPGVDNPAPLLCVAAPPPSPMGQRAEAAALAERQQREREELEAALAADLAAAAALGAGPAVGAGAAADWTQPLAAEARVHAARAEFASGCNDAALRVQEAFAARLQEREVWHRAAASACVLVCVGFLCVRPRVRTLVHCRGLPEGRRTAPCGSDFALGFRAICAVSPAASALCVPYANAHHLVHGRRGLAWRCLPCRLPGALLRTARPARAASCWTRRNRRRWPCPTPPPAPHAWTRPWHGCGPRRRQRGRRRRAAQRPPLPRRSLPASRRSRWGCACGV